MRHLSPLLLAFALLSASAQSVGDSIFPALGQRGLDVQHYDLRLRVADPARAEVAGDVTLTVLAREKLSSIQLDLTGPRVSAAQWNGQAAGWVQRADKVEVKLPRPLSAGQTGRLRLVYAGEPQGSVLAPFSFAAGWQVSPEARLSYSLSEPHGTRSFLPSADHPSDPATFTVRVTVPPPYSAAASGLLTEVRTLANGERRFTFTQRTPIPTYALALMVGPLERRVLAPVTVAGQTIARRDVVGAGLSLNAAESETAQMMRVLSDWFGPYPNEVYGIAVLPIEGAALETATLSTFPAASNRERTRAHELAHQWFGNRVTLGDWADTWLNEGFATYAELLWFESQGQDTAPLLRLWRTGLGEGRPLRATAPEQLFDGTAYYGGALALHALREEVGDAAFREFLRAYAAAFATRPTSTAAFLAFVQERLGMRAAETVRGWVEGVHASK